MAKKKRDLRSLILELWKLAAAAQAHEGALPSLARFRVSLQAKLEEIVAAKKQQSNLENLRREATQDLWNRVADAKDTAARLKNLVRASFGRQRERLAAFDIKLGGRRSGGASEKKGGNGSPGYHH